MTYLGVVGLCCVACPPLLGFILGIGLFYGLTWITYRVISS